MAMLHNESTTTTGGTISSSFFSSRLKRCALAIVALLSSQYIANQSWPDILSYHAVDFQQQKVDVVVVHSRSLQLEEEEEEVAQPVLRTHRLPTSSADTFNNNNNKTQGSTTTISNDNLKKINHIQVPQDSNKTTALRITKPATTTISNKQTTIRIFSASRIDNAKHRYDRFPTVEERVKLYMGDWHLPPCDIAQDTYEFEYQPPQDYGTTVMIDDNLIVHSKVLPDNLLVFNSESIQECLYMFMYCDDVMERMLPVVVGDDNNNNNIPVLIQFGDRKRSWDHGIVTVPHFKKFRYARNHEHEHNEDTCITRSSSNNDILRQPIIWKLEIERHYGMIRRVLKSDIDWSKKKPQAIFRGQLTGAKPHDKSITTDVQLCRMMRRCRMVYDHMNSTLIDALLSKAGQGIPSVLSDGTRIASGTLLGVPEQLQYKAIVMQEGNDIASGLKWALLSNSVVIMPVPKFTSWAMEELLEPWVHYIPIEETGSDLEERMQWVLDNDDKAKRIAERGTLWMQDLVLHKDAERDARKVEEESFRRYRMHFREKVSTMSES